VVWYNSRERGGRLGMDTSLGISVSCTKCNHIARVRLDVALRLWGERSFSLDIARDLRCSRCGARAASTQVISDSRPPWVIEQDPDGGFLMGPNYPIVDPPPAPATLAVLRRGWLAPPPLKLRG
jgi:hypothetical protein